MSHTKKGNASWAYTSDQLAKLRRALESPEERETIFTELATEKNVTKAAISNKFSKMRKEAVAVSTTKRKKKKKNKPTKARRVHVTTNEGELSATITSLDINMKNRQMRIKFSY